MLLDMGRDSANLAGVELLLPGMAVGGLTGLWLRLAEMRGTDVAG